MLRVEAVVTLPSVDRGLPRRQAKMEEKKNMSRKSWRSRHLLILMVVLALFAAACGDAGEGTTTTAAGGGDEDPLGVWEIA